MDFRDKQVQDEFQKIIETYPQVAAKLEAVTDAAFEAYKDKFPDAMERCDAVDQDAAVIEARREHSLYLYLKENYEFSMRYNLDCLWILDLPNVERLVSELRRIGLDKFYFTSWYGDVNVEDCNELPLLLDDLSDFSQAGCTFGEARYHDCPVGIGKKEFHKYPALTVYLPKEEKTV